MCLESEFASGESDLRKIMSMQLKDALDRLPFPSHRTGAQLGIFEVNRLRYELIDIVDAVRVDDETL